MLRGHYKEEQTSGSNEVQIENSNVWNKIGNVTAFSGNTLREKNKIRLLHFTEEKTTKTAWMIVYYWWCYYTFQCSPCVFSGSVIWGSSGNIVSTWSKLPIIQSARSPCNKLPRHRVTSSFVTEFNNCSISGEWIRRPYVNRCRPICWVEAQIRSKQTKTLTSSATLWLPSSWRAIFGRSAFFASSSSSLKFGVSLNVIKLKGTNHQSN